MPRRNENKQLTPFADALEQWMLHEHRFPWSRPKLSAETGIPPSTINGWYREVNDPRQPPSFPEPDAFYALLRVTGWSPEKLMELTGYTELPTKATSESEFIREFAEKDNGLTDLEKEKFSRLITRAMAEYLNRPKRPPRRGKNAGS